MNLRPSMVLAILMVLATQLSLGAVLVVDDDNRYNNEDRIHAALDNNGIAYDIFDTDAVGAAPDSSTLAGYDLVIWGTGDDYSALYFWNGDESDNTALIGYLENGGRLWVMGLDVLYDRYGAAADTFSAGDFVYDYFGISSYDAQSYSDDGSVGVGQLDQTENTLSSIDPITWNTSSGTLRYVDAVTLAPGATSHYTMGPTGYVFEGKSAIQSQVTEDFTVLTSWLNLYYFNTTIDRDTWVGDVYDWFVASTDAPSDFTLLLPEDGTHQVLDAPTGLLRFTWNDSFDPEEENITYTFFLEEVDGDTLVTVDTLGTDADLDYSDVLPFVTDTLEAMWYVRASDGLAETWSDTFQIQFALEINQGPGDVILLEPADGRGYRLVDVPNEGLELVWRETLDPNDDAVTYDLYVDVSTTPELLADDLSDTTFTLSRAAIESYMGTADFVNIEWWVVATDGEFESTSATFSFTVAEQDITILVVDDDEYQNYEYSLYESLERLGVVYDSFDCAAADVAPTVAELLPYDLVIWYTGSDGADLYFWNGDETDNTALADYLQAGGRLWQNGLDLLYDRYGGAPETYQPGSFVYDYLGITSYDAQSRMDDGSLGVPLLTAVDGGGITALDTVTWRFSTAWYVDAVTPNPYGFSNYVMGPDDYALAGGSVVQHAVRDGYVVLSSFFNLNHFETDALRDTLTADVLTWFQAVGLGDAPADFSLLNPIDDDTLSVFFSDSGDVTFNWESTTDTEDGTLAYRFMLGIEDPAGYAPLFFAEMDTVGFVINEAEFYDLLGTELDTLRLVWKVLAFDEDHNITEAAPHHLTILRDLGSGPAPFSLLEPANDSRVRVHADHPGAVTFLWEATTDAENDPISYTFSIARDDTMEVYNAEVADTSLDLTTAELLAILGEDESLVLGWKVVASDGQFETPCFLPFEFEIVNLPPQEISILVVDDDDRYNNEWEIHQALEANYFAYDTFDCAAADSAPGLDLMTTYDLLLWCTGDDGVDLYFWNGAESSDNANVAAYLEQGGRIWIQGLDVIYDRYGSAPRDFGPGELMFDYFGTRSYVAQSWADDGNTGLSHLERVEPSTVTELDTLEWNTSTGVLKWVDGCELAAGALVDMEMGGQEYNLADLAVSYHYTDGNFISMCSWINPHYISTEAIRHQWIGDVVSWFEATLVPTAPDAAELLLPAEGEILTITDETESISFGWNAVSGDDLIYQLALRSDAADALPVALTTPGTAMDVDVDILFDLVGFENDTVTLEWSVITQNPWGGLSSSVSRNHALIEGINEAPSAFVLLSPADGDTLLMEQAEDEYTFSWSTSIDPDGDVLEYNLVMAIPGDVILDTTITDTQLVLNAMELSTIMGGAAELLTSWRVSASDGEFEVQSDPWMLTLYDDLVGVNEAAVPVAYALRPNFPNPFNPSTTIAYDLPEDTRVHLSVYDLRGRQVAVLVDAFQPAAYHQLQWYGRDTAGRLVSTGVYFARLEAGSFSKVIKMVYMK